MSETNNSFGEKTEVDEEAFTLSPGDSFSVNVFRQKELNRTVRITPDGNIYLPLAGRVKAEKLSVGELEKNITRRLSKYIVNPQVDINIDQLVNQKVYVLGEVVSPGVVAYQGDIHIFEAISEAGGFTQDADKSNIFLISESAEKVKVVAVSYTDLFSSGEIEACHYLDNKNIVYVKERKIASFAVFMQRLNTILSPFVTAENAVVLGEDAVNAVTGESDEENNIIVIPE